MNEKPKRKQACDYLYYDITKDLYDADEMDAWLAQHDVLPKAKRKRKADTRHPTLDVLMNQHRYDGICAEFGKAVVDENMQQYVDWATTKNRQVLEAAAATANWMKRNNVQPLPKAVVQLPDPVCECGGRMVVDADTAMCRGCRRFWDLVAGQWQPAAEVGANAD